MSLRSIAAYGSTTYFDVISESGETLCIEIRPEQKIKARLPQKLLFAF